MGKLIFIDLRDASGVQETYRNRMIVIARTEIQRVANDVALATYAENSDVIEAVEWLATLDSRTCLVCAALHGKVYPLVNGKPVGMLRAPPIHPRDRCFLAPQTRSWAALGLAPVGHVETKGASGPTFEQWLRRQDAETQDDVMGVERADLWRARKLSLDKFSDQGRLLNLGELRVRYD